MPTLYINGKDTEARLDDRRISVSWLDFKNNDVAKIDVPLHDLDRVVIIGKPSVSMAVLHSFIKNNIPVYLLSYNGHWLGSMMPNNNGNGIRRLRQYEVDSDQNLQIRVAKRLVHSKIRNMRRVLQRLAANRRQSEDDAQTDACNSLAKLLDDLWTADSLDSVRGYEGVATSVYFGRLGSFFPPDVPFTTRSRRPPRDEANALLSWTYSIVMAEIEAEIRCAGLDPSFGFLHEMAYGRPSLACDLIEPLRAPLCDLLVLNLLNHGLIKSDNFHRESEDGGVYLNNDIRGTFFAEYEEYMERRFAEAKGGQHVTFRRVIRNMVNSVCNIIENKEDEDFFLMP
ncbi:MAG: CRISPR-associated endonuclease Cas1 [Victivallales bacterium]|nr:CRISPR-associated endonuclease Cas1 [Victivallales bacterium]